MSYRFVQVERLDDPSLVGLPLAVTQFNSGGFVAVSYEARAAGIRRVRHRSYARDCACKGRCWGPWQGQQARHVAGARGMRAAKRTVAVNGTSLFSAGLVITGTPACACAVATTFYKGGAISAARCAVSTFWPVEFLFRQCIARQGKAARLWPRPLTAHGTRTLRH